MLSSDSPFHMTTSGGCQNGVSNLPVRGSRACWQGSSLWTTEAELIPFSFTLENEEELQAAPCVYTPNLVQQILGYLDELEE